MKLFEELMDKTAKFADEAVKVGREAFEQTKVATGEAVEKGKKKVAQLQLEADLKDAYKRLGETVYAQHITGEKDENELEEMFGEIAEIMAALEALLTDVTTTFTYDDEDEGVAGEIFEEVNEIFEEVKEEVSEAVEELKGDEKVCPACGAKADDDDIFCRGCGNKLM